MSAYHQLGHQSGNLVLEPHLSAFGGVILSPVNCAPADMATQCSQFRAAGRDLDIVFDPQLYVPRKDRGQLASWPYMPDNFDTRDVSSVDAWSPIMDAVLAATAAFAPNAICSPAPYLGAFVDDYYSLLVGLGNGLYEKLRGTGTRPFLTALVDLGGLGIPDRYLQVASILSQYEGTDIYLVFCDDTKPRYERTNSGQLEGAARLIRLLKRADYRMLVSTTSSEMLLWKAAGADHVASGKFFNLRRFTRGRFDPAEEGGGRNIWYWFEPSLLAFLRQADLARFVKIFGVTQTHHANPRSQIMLQKIQDPTQPPVTGDSWRQFLFWFAQSEQALTNDPSLAKQWLDAAEAMWSAVGEAKLRFEEKQNVGDWVRAWGIVLNELHERPD